LQKRQISLAATACVIAMLGAAPAHAAIATFVSGNGSDSNDCLTPATACRQIGGEAGAIAKTDAFGTVHVLPGSYLTFTVDKSLNITAEGGLASLVTNGVEIPGGGLASILVTGSGGAVVRIHGFLIDFGGAGIVDVAPGTSILHVEDCVISSGGFGGPNSFAVDFRPTGPSEVYVIDTIASRGANVSIGGGIRIKPSSGASVIGSLDNVRVEDNIAGVIVDGRATTGANSVSIRNSVVGGSSGIGVFAVDSGGGSTAVMIEESAISDNATGVASNGANATVRMRNSTVTGNSTQGLKPSAGSQIISGRGNLVQGNATNGAFTSTVAQQ